MNSRGAHQRVDIVVAHEDERGYGQGGDMRRVRQEG